MLYVTRLEHGTYSINWSKGWTTSASHWEWMKGFTSLSMHC